MDKIYRKTRGLSQTTIEFGGTPSEYLHSDHHFQINDFGITSDDVVLYCAEVAIGKTKKRISVVEPSKVDVAEKSAWIHVTGKDSQKHRVPAKVVTCDLPLGVAIVRFYDVEEETEDLGEFF